MRLRLGWRYRWVPGVAEILPDDDALARQRRIIRWHPCPLNAINVRVLGADLFTVRVRLNMPRDAAARESAAATRATAPAMRPRPAPLLRITLVYEQLPTAASRTR